MKIRPRRRATLATRISLLSIGIAVITALIAGALAIGLIRNYGTGEAQRTLGRLADVGQAVVVAEHSGAAPLNRLRTALKGLHVRSSIVLPSGIVIAVNPLVRKAIRTSDVDMVLAGQSVSAIREVDGTSVFVEGRPTGDGGFVIVQRERDAVAQDEQAIRRIVLALLIAGALAAAIGLFVAWRLARPLRRVAGAAHILATGNRDVTLRAEGPAEVVEVSEAINALAGALAQSEGRQREFLLSVSHDLRTPLTAISGYAESLADGVIPAEDSAHVGGVVLGEAKRLERLVGDLLDLARVGADDFRVEFAVVDVVALAQSAARVWDTRCAAAGVEFQLDVAAEPVLARTDPTRLRQALDGLLENALRVTPSGAPIILAVRSENAGVQSASRSVIAEVRDGGPGLTDSDLSVAFEQGALYARYRGVRRVGTGLGLAIVQSLVTRLDGTVEAGHAAEGGARFTMRLPAARSAAGAER